MNQAARTAPAAARNREPILQVLRDCLPPSALVLEIASGTGEHAVWFCRRIAGADMAADRPGPGGIEKHRGLA